MHSWELAELPPQDPFFSLMLLGTLNHTWKLALCNTFSEHNLKHSYLEHGHLLWCLQFPICHKSDLPFKSILFIYWQYFASQPLKAFGQDSSVILSRRQRRWKIDVHLGFWLWDPTRDSRRLEARLTAAPWGEPCLCHSLYPQYTHSSLTGLSPPLGTGCLETVHFSTYFFIWGNSQEGNTKEWAEVNSPSVL